MRRREKGIGYLFHKKLDNWTRIEKIAKEHGVYEPADLARLIKNHSPLKHIGIYNMNILRICYEGNKKEWPKFKNVSFYEIIKNNIERLDLLMGNDPRTIHHGSNWEKIQKKKDKNFKRSNHPRAIKGVIENIRKRHNDNIAAHGTKEFLGWYKANKQNSWEDFLDYIIRSLHTKKKDQTVVFNNKVLRDDNKISKTGRGKLGTPEGAKDSFVISGNPENAPNYSKKGTLRLIKK